MISLGGSSAIVPQIQYQRFRFGTLQQFKIFFIEGLIMSLYKIIDLHDRYAAIRPDEAEIFTVGFSQGGISLLSPFFDSALLRPLSSVSGFEIFTSLIDAH